MDTDRFDLAIVGSGGAGFAAAIAARRAGASVVMVERGTVGGTCVNTGCVPSKALLAAVEAQQVALSAKRFPGVHASAGPVAFGELIAGKDALVGQMRSGKYVDLAADYGWQIITGTARFGTGDDGPLLEVELGDGGVSRIEAAHYLVATGSAPALPPIDGLDTAGYLTSTTAMRLDAARLDGGDRRQRDRAGAGSTVRPSRYPRGRCRGIGPAGAVRRTRSLPSDPGRVRRGGHHSAHPRHGHRRAPR